MSCGRRKGKGGGKKDKSFGDVSINDYANAVVCKNRVKKSNASVTQVVKQMTVNIDTRSWEEKLDDFEGDFDFVCEENEDGTTNVFTVKQSSETTKRRSKKNSCSQDFDRTGGNEYPLDIWFLISEYIRPEDVGRFAGICQSTLAVVNSAKFWFNIYKRYYRTVPNLPERLQPECMVRLYGLRSCVIRALHYMYPPFVNKFKCVTTFEDDPHNLIKRQCVLMWHEKYISRYVYYFKLKEQCNTSSALSMQRYRTCNASSKQQPDLIEMLDDVFANQDENCRILQVTCFNYVRLPFVLGLSLASVSLTLSQGFRHHRLQLTFSSNVACRSAGGHVSLDSNSSSVIVLDPIYNVRVLDWWHPQYPCSATTADLLNQQLINQS